MTTRLGTPRLHHRSTDSTNERAKALAACWAPHGTLVTAAEQTAGHGRQGRTWTAPAGEGLLMSLVLREWPEMLPLVAAVALAETCGDGASIKWPNDVLLGDRKVAGILVEARPVDGWAVLGVGVNVAVSSFPPELQGVAGSLGMAPTEIEPFLAALLASLERWFWAEDASILDAWRSRDALDGRTISWNGGEGVAEGVDADGRLLVRRAGGETTALDAGEVHLTGLS